MSRSAAALLGVCALLLIATPADAERRTRIGPTVLYHHADFIADAYEQSSGTPPNIPEIGAALSLGIAVTHIEPVSDALGLLIALRIATSVAVADDRGGRPLSDYKSPRIVGDGIIGIGGIRGRPGTVQIDAGGGFYFVNVMIQGSDINVPSVETRLLGGLGVESAVSLPLSDLSDLFAAGAFGYSFFPLTAGTRRTNSVLGASLTVGVQFRH